MRPWNIAHRGGAQLRPENTLSAFACAVAKGCDGAELDVQLSYDGEVIVFHDYRLKPELCRDEGRWLIPPPPRLKDLSLAELRHYDVGRADPQSAYARGHAGVAWQDGECIPTLDEVVAVVKTARGTWDADLGALSVLPVAEAMEALEASPERTPARGAIA